MRRIVLVHRKRWPRPPGWNHFDTRPCPVCGADVNGKEGQDRHTQHHLEQDEWVGRVNKILGLGDEPTTWNAASDGTVEEIEGAYR